MAVSWAKRAAELFHDGTFNQPHRRLLSDDVIWCDACGAYADSFSVCLSKPCPGRPSCVGKRAHLHSLRSGRHPRTGDCFRSSPIPEPRPHAPLHPHHADPPYHHTHREWGSGNSTPLVKDMKPSVPGAARRKMDALRIRCGLSITPARDQDSITSSVLCPPHANTVVASAIPLPSAASEPVAKRRRITRKTAVVPSTQLATNVNTSPNDTPSTASVAVHLHAHQERRLSIEHHTPAPASAVPDPLPAGPEGFKRRRITGKRQPTDTACINREKAFTAASSSTSHSDALRGLALAKIDATTSDANSSAPLPRSRLSPDSSSPLHAPCATDSFAQHPLTRKQLIARLTGDLAQCRHLFKRPRMV